MKVKVLIIVSIAMLLCTGCRSKNIITYNGEDNTLHIFENKKSDLVSDKLDDTKKDIDSDDSVDPYEGYVATYYDGKGLNSTIELNGVKYTVKKTEITREYREEGMIQYDKHHEGQFKVKNNKIQGNYRVLYVFIEIENTNKEKLQQYCCNPFLDDKSQSYGNSYDSLMGKGKYAYFYELKSKEKVQLVQGSIFTEKELKNLNLYLLFEPPVFVDDSIYDKDIGKKEVIKVYDANSYKD